jgi:ABC-2 type transport system permease protein
MRQFSTYTGAQIKRSARYLPFVFLVTLVICLCLGVLLISTLGANSSKDDQAKIRIGITGDFEDTFLGFGLSAIQSFDSSRFALELVECDEVQAAVDLRKGNISGYVVIPENFIDNAVYDEVGRLQFVTNYTNADIMNLVKQEILQLVSCIIVESQKGVYGMQELLYKFGLEYDEVYDETLVISADYISMVLARSNALDVKILPEQKNLTFEGYMFSGITVLLMLLAGIVTCPLFVRRDISLYRLLSANRNRAATQIAGEYLAFFLLMLINNIILLFALMMGTGTMTGVIPELRYLDAVEMISIILKFIPVMALITSLQFFMYQLADSIVSGVLMQFISAVLLAYLSGCFYPISFFPESIQKISALIPPGIAREYLSSLLIDEVKISNIISIFLYFAVFTSLSILSRRSKIKNA